MNDFGFFLGFIALIIILALSGADGKGLFSDTASSTDSAITETDESISGPGTEYQDGTTIESAAPTEPKLTPAEIERKVAESYRQLDDLGEKLRVQKLHEPVSPYAGKVELEIGNARSTDWKQEYLTLRASSNNSTNINISNWYLESYVTEEVAALPEGDRTLEKWRSPKKSAIFLEPGETAYILTGESPIDTSFHENTCTGYLTEQKTFSPSLSRSCPAPMDEMKRFADIALDNDRCYDFVERINYCTTPNDDLYNEAKLNGACRQFIDSTLNYNDCVLKHEYDPFFDDVGYWHIYLERDEDLWRYEREIIQLKDENDRIIDVLEY